MANDDRFDIFLFNVNLFWHLLYIWCVPELDEKHQQCHVVRAANWVIKIVSSIKLQW